MVPVVESLGACTYLKELCLSLKHMGPLAGNALASLLESGSPSDLRKLDLRRSSFCYNEDDSIAARIIDKARSCRCLRSLNASGNYLQRGSNETCSAIAAAMRDKAWPRLEELYFYCPNVDCMRDIAKVLCAPGGSPGWLRKVKVMGGHGQYYVTSMKDLAGFAPPAAGLSPDR